MKKSREHLRKEDRKRKKENYDNRDDNEKEQLRNYEKKGKKVMCDNLDDEKKDHLKKKDNKEKEKSVITWMTMGKSS